MHIQDITTGEMRNIYHRKENMVGLSIEEVNDVEQFRSLRESWDTLLRESSDNNIFLTWEWLFTWWQHYGHDKKLRILIIRKSGKIVGIAPLMQSKYRKGIISVDVIENICSMNCDYSGVILKEIEPEFIIILLDYLTKIIKNRNIVIRMSHIPESSSFLSLLREQYPSFSDSIFLTERPIASCPYIMLPATLEEYLHTFKKKRRGNLKRLMQSLQKDHKVEIKKCAADDNLRDQLQVLFEFHHRRWQGSSIGKIFSKPETREFYVNVSEAFHQNNWLDMSFLHVDEKPVSVCWGFIYNGTFHDHTIAFDPSYSDYSVGTLHMLKLIEDAIQNGRMKFDFLQGAEAYKSRYARSKTVNFQITMAQKGIRGRYGLMLLQIFTKLDNIGSRSLRENYHRLLERRRQRRVSTDD